MYFAAISQTLAATSPPLEELWHPRHTDCGTDPGDTQMNRRHKLMRLVSAAVVILAIGCATPIDPAVQRPGVSFAVVPSQGSSVDLDMATWNIEWFGHTGFGPTNEQLQLQNVGDVMRGADMDIWGLEEVVSAPQFQQLVGSLPGYAGILANDPFVVNGATYYNDFSNTEQKVALVYRTSVVSVLSAKVILTNLDFEFAGRPPVEFKVRITLNGVTRDATVIVLHAKSGSDNDSYNRRLAASQGLKNYLDTTYPTEQVWVLGDFNDDVDVSITTPLATPYGNFVNDAARYTFPTKALSDAGKASTVTYPDMVDHQLNTNEVYATYVPGSAQVYRVDQYIANYGTTTTDHYPILARYTVGAPPANRPPTASFTYSCTGLSCSFTDTSVDPDGTIAGWSWTFGDGATASVQNPSRTYAAGGTYTVGLTVTDNGGATGTASQAVTVTSGGGGPANVIVNEILANEPGSNTAGEAVEIVNVGGTAADLSGWTVSDASRVRHTFAAGTTLAPGKAIAVYGGASAIPPGITAVAASTGSLNLSNNGDAVILRNAAAAVINQFTYTSALSSTDGVSMNRNPDTSPTGGFVLHTALSTLPSSIGKRANGSAF
jgi:PKD repeat protein